MIETVEVEVKMFHDWSQIENVPTSFQVGNSEVETFEKQNHGYIAGVH